LNSVPGVAEVAFGRVGTSSSIKFDVDPNKLRGLSIPLSTVVRQSRRSNNNVGGNVVEQAGQWAVVRGIGLIQLGADVENTVIGSSNGTPIYVRNVADVHLGSCFGTGVLDKDGKEALAAWSSARYGVNMLDVIEG